MDRPLHTYTYLDAPFDLVSRLLAEDATAVLQRATDAGDDETRQLSRSLKVAIGGFELGREVTVRLGEFQPVEVARSVVPVRWEAASGRSLFPAVAAQLEVAAVTLDPPRTQVTLDGTYQPPLGWFGAGVDALLLHRLAEAAVHRFVEEVAAQLRQKVEAIPVDERF